MSTSADDSPLHHAVEWAHRQEEAYTHGEDRPLSGYVRTMATYIGAGLAAAAVVKLSRRELPDRFRAGDLALVAIGTHKTARLLAKDPVTSPLRAPVTRFEGTGGPSELNEEVRADGPAHAVGELLTCPFCVGQWVATAGMFGLVLAPRATRFAASTMTVVAAADFLHLLYAAAQKQAT